MVFILSEPIGESVVRQAQYLTSCLGLFLSSARKSYEMGVCVCVWGGVLLVFSTYPCTALSVFLYELGESNRENSLRTPMRFPKAITSVAKHSVPFSTGICRGG